MIGETVSHYRILEKLGEGGMGVVYRAQDTKLEREVALKFLPADLVKSAEAKQRFVKEAQTASVSRSPRTYARSSRSTRRYYGRLFLAMAYYEGDSVGDLVVSGPVETEGALSIAQQIVQGLIKAHERGIVHRDIKPGNVLITSDGLVKIVDFGLAMLTGQTGLPRQAISSDCHLYVPRTDTGERGRSAHRPLVDGRGAVRDGDRKSSVHRGLPAGGRLLDNQQRSSSDDRPWRRCTRGTAENNIRPAWPRRRRKDLQSAQDLLETISRRSVRY